VNACSRDDIGIDRIGICWVNALVFSRDARRIFLRWAQKWIGSMMPSHCPGSFSIRNRTGISLSFMPARSTSVVCPGRAESGEDGHVVLVLLRGVERHGKRQIGELVWMPFC